MGTFLSCYVLHTKKDTRSTQHAERHGRHAMSSGVNTSRMILSVSRASVSSRREMANPAWTMT